MRSCQGPVIKEMQKILLREVIDNPQSNTREILMDLCERNVIQASSNVQVSKDKRLTEENHMIETSKKVDSYLSDLSSSQDKKNDSELVF